MSDDGKNALESMVYPGRGIILGKTVEELPFAAYFVTGRSPSSKARFLEEKKNGVNTAPTDPEVLKTGDPALLLYPALLWCNTGIAVSNGAQTPDVLAGLEASSMPTLADSVSKWMYEPDKPNYTPRIQGRIFKTLAYEQMVLGIIRKDPSSDDALRQDFAVDPQPGEGYLITTYSGENQNPLPHFTGAPKALKIKGRDAGDISEAVGNMLNPDFRVSVVAAILNPDFQKPLVDIINYMKK